VLNNTILWGNDVPSACGRRIYTLNNSSIVTLNYCDYAKGDGDIEEGFGTVTPDNCINIDPLFVGAGDYHLQGTSPCIDVGSNALVPDDVTTVDIGAYEF